MGRDNADSHSLAYCYANPKNPEHKPWRVRARYRDLVRLKKPIPECMQEFAAQEGQKAVEGAPAAPGDDKKEQIRKQMVSFGEDL